MNIVIDSPQYMVRLGTVIRRIPSDTRLAITWVDGAERFAQVQWVEAGEAHTDHVELCNLEHIGPRPPREADKAALLEHLLESRDVCNARAKYERDVLFEELGTTFDLLHRYLERL